MSDPKEFYSPFNRLIDEVIKMPALKWEGHDAKDVGWEGKPDPEEWAAVKWMAENVRPTLLAQQVFRTLRSAGVIQVGEGGAIKVYTLDQKAEVTAARRSLAMELRSQREREKRENKKPAGNRKKACRILDVAEWTAGYYRKASAWPNVEQLMNWVQTDESGPRRVMCRMTLHRHRSRAAAAGVLICERRGREVYVLPGPKFPPELLPPALASADEDPAL